MAYAFYFIQAIICFDLNKNIREIMMKSHTTMLYGFLFAGILALSLISSPSHATVVMKPTPLDGREYRAILEGDYDYLFSTLG